MQRKYSCVKGTEHNSKHLWQYSDNEGKMFN